MIADDSPLRRLPAALVPGQKMFFNAIRFSAEVMATSMTGLRQVLQTIAVTASDGDERRSDLYPPAMMLAWSAVDAANRFRVLVESMRRLGWVERSPKLRASLVALDDARPLRDAAQHLDDHIKRAVRDDVTSPVWGVLSWFAVLEVDEATGTIVEGVVCTLLPGSVVSTVAPMVNPAGRGPMQVVDEIALSAFGSSVSLSKLESIMERMVEAFEDSCREQFEAETDTVGADLLVVGRVRGVPDDAATTS